MSGVGTSRRFAALRNLIVTGGIADMAGLAAGSTRSRMTRRRHVRPFPNDGSIRYNCRNWEPRGDMKRRDFIKLVGGACAISAVSVARSQETGRTPRIGILADDRILTDAHGAPIW